MPKCRVAFVGCVAEGMESLLEIIECGGHVVAILTFTDEMAKKTSGAVSFDEIARLNDIPLYKIKNTNTPEAVKLVKELAPDVMFVIGWTRLVSAEVLAIPKYGCIGMHASLLPKYRGRAPVNWALINNEQETGNTMILLDDGVDTGDILLQKRIPITISDTCKTLYDKVAHAGRTMIREIIPYLDRGELPRKAQNHDQATLMPKRSPEDGLIDWNKSGLQLFNWIRAVTHPYPGAFTHIKGMKLFIWEAHLAHYSQLNEVHDSTQPGTVVSVDDGLTILTGIGDLLNVRRLNFYGEDEQPWDIFLKTHDMKVGNVFG